MYAPDIPRPALPARADADPIPEIRELGKEIGGLRDQVDARNREVQEQVRQQFDDLRRVQQQDADAILERQGAQDLNVRRAIAAADARFQGIDERLHHGEVSLGEGRAAVIQEINAAEERLVSQARRLVRPGEGYDDIVIDEFESEQRRRPTLRRAPPSPVDPEGGVEVAGGGEFDLPGIQVTPLDIRIEQEDTDTDTEEEELELFSERRTARTPRPRTTPPPRRQRDIDVGIQARAELEAQLLEGVEEISPPRSPTPSPVSRSPSLSPERPPPARPPTPPPAAGLEDPFDFPMGGAVFAPEDPDIVDLRNRLRLVDSQDQFDWGAPGGGEPEPEDRPSPREASTLREAVIQASSEGLDLTDLREEVLEARGAAEDPAEQEQGYLGQAGEALGGAAAGVGGAALGFAGGVAQGVGQGIYERLPEAPGAADVGAFMGRGVVAGAELAGGAAYYGGARVLEAGAGALGLGEVEEVEEPQAVAEPQAGLREPVEGEGEAEFLNPEEIGEVQNSAQGRIEESKRVYQGSFVELGGARPGPKGARGTRRGLGYRVRNNTNKPLKKIQPGDVVDIIGSEKGADQKGRYRLDTQTDRGTRIGLTAMEPLINDGSLIFEAGHRYQLGGHFEHNPYGPPGPPAPPGSPRHPPAPFEEGSPRLPPGPPSEEEELGEGEEEV
tara:strand:- start:1063 stop:3075 length:2013 start_codon:yes stop_codon:yes gene_type:complete